MWSAEYHNVVTCGRGCLGASSLIENRPPLHHISARRHRGKTHHLSKRTGRHSAERPLENLQELRRRPTDRVCRRPVRWLAPAGHAGHAGHDAKLTLLLPWCPVDDDGDRRGRCLDHGVDEKPLAVSCDVVVPAVHQEKTAPRARRMTCAPEQSVFDRPSRATPKGRCQSSDRHFDKASHCRRSISLPGP